VKDTILIVEDEELLGSELVRHHHNRGLDAVWAKTLAEARVWLVERRLEPLVVLSDMSLPDGNALDLLESVHGNATEWILLTGFGTIPDSVRALRLGAYDFLEKTPALPIASISSSPVPRAAHAHNGDCSTRRSCRTAATRSTPSAARAAPRVSCTRCWASCRRFR
jgi:DNA-binding NtrC family response regulator